MVKTSIHKDYLQDSPDNSLSGRQGYLDLWMFMANHPNENEWYFPASSQNGTDLSKVIQQQDRVSQGRFPKGPSWAR